MRGEINAMNASNLLGKDPTETISNAAVCRKPLERAFSHGKVTCNHDNKGNKKEED